MLNLINKYLIVVSSRVLFYNGVSKHLLVRLLEILWGRSNPPNSDLLNSIKAKKARTSKSDLLKIQE